jgi:hypothetical protein
VCLLLILVSIWLQASSKKELSFKVRQSTFRKFRTHVYHVVIVNLSVLPGVFCLTNPSTPSSPTCVWHMWSTAKMACTENQFLNSLSLSVLFLFTVTF